MSIWLESYVGKSNVSQTQAPECCNERANWELVFAYHPTKYRQRNCSNFQSDLAYSLVRSNIVASEFDVLVNTQPQIESVMCGAYMRSEHVVPYIHEWCCWFADWFMHKKCKQTRVLSFVVCACWYRVRGNCVRSSISFVPAAKVVGSASVRSVRCVRCEK